jgi:hypothetical protein
MTPDDLDARLADMERRVPVDVPSPSVGAARPWPRRRLAALAGAPILVLLVAATAVGAAGLISFSVSTVPIDETLARAGLECMAPPEAGAWLASHGYEDVVWDTGIIRSGEIGSLPGRIPAGGHGALDLGAQPIPSGMDATAGVVVIGSSGEIVPGAQAPAGSPVVIGPISPGDGSSSATPPAEGVVAVGPIVDGTLHMIVDTSEDAARPATCTAP